MVFSLTTWVGAKGKRKHVRERGKWRHGPGCTDLLIYEYSIIRIIYALMSYLTLGHQALSFFNIKAMTGTEEMLKMASAVLISIFHADVTQVHMFGPYVAADLQ